jgi:hypothetical protein
MSSYEVKRPVSAHDSTGSAGDMGRDPGGYSPIHGNTAQQDVLLGGPPIADPTGLDALFSIEPALAQHVTRLQERLQANADAERNNAQWLELRRRQVWEYCGTSLPSAGELLSETFLQMVERGPSTGMGAEGYEQQMTDRWCDESRDNLQSRLADQQRLEAERDQLEREISSAQQASLRQRTEAISSESTSIRSPYQQPSSMPL